MKIIYVRAENLESLQEKVNDILDVGYFPFGGPVVLESAPWCIQGMILCQHFLDIINKQTYLDAII